MTAKLHSEEAEALRVERDQRARIALREFPARIAQRLADLGITRNELARRSGVDAASLHRYVKQGSLPDTRQLWLIADALGCSSDWLLGLGPKEGA